MWLRKFVLVDTVAHFGALETSSAWAVEDSPEDLEAHLQAIQALSLEHPGAVEAYPESILGHLSAQLGLIIDLTCLCSLQKKKCTNKIISGF